MNRLLILLFLLTANLTCLAQELRVTPSADKNKINRETSDGIASVIFESGIKDLIISNEMNDECITLPDGMTIFLIKPESDDIVKELGYPRRTYLLKTPKTPEYLLEISEILPNNVYFYTVTLPNKFPLAFTAEYLFSGSANYGLRLSFGKQFGGYISYRWGKYKASGNNIDDIKTDGDISNATYLGHIRQAATAGVRIGLLYHDILNSKLGVYLLVGGGYGKYGRQWQNPTRIEGSVFFYSDYISGFNGDLALQCTLGDWIVLSAGADAIIANGRASFDYQIGVGFNLNFTKLFKRKSK